MQISKDSLLWAIISLLIGTVFGSGAIWQWQKKNLERDRLISYPLLHLQMTGALADH